MDIHYCPSQFCEFKSSVNRNPLLKELGLKLDIK